VTTDAAVLAVVTRNGVDESVHHGDAVIVDAAGRPVRTWGSPDRTVLPRSSLKPAQAAAMVRAGLDLPAPLLALAAASHSAEPFHLAGVRDILASAGLSETDLRTPPDVPWDPQERAAWGTRAPSTLAMNCSGKHAAMLATCVVQDWPLDDYRAPDHPLQEAIAAEVVALAGEPIAAVGVDGCGAPVLGISLTGLARLGAALGAAADDEPGARVAAAMRAHPEYVAGTRRDVTLLMRSVPGLLAKEGAEGVGLAVLPGGGAVAVKVADGADRAREVALVALLAAAGVTVAAADIPVLGGGVPVGRVWSPLA
jgi:L-asparaginase II